MQVAGMTVSTIPHMCNVYRYVKILNGQLFYYNYVGNCITTAKLQQELHAVSDWFTLGLQLNVQYYKLTEIENAYPSPMRRQAEMFQAWIDGQFEPSWSAVVEALLHTGMESLAHQLAHKYGIILYIQNQYVTLFVYNAFADLDLPKLYPIPIEIMYIYQALILLLLH